MHDEHKNSKSQGPRVGGRPTETLDFRRLAMGDPMRLEMAQQILLSQERFGWFRIVRMDDETATIEWLDDAAASLLSSAGRA